MKAINLIALALVILGGLNWGLFGLTGIDAVASLFGVGTAAAKTAYVIVGLAAIYSIALFKPVAMWSDAHRDANAIPPAQPVR